MALKVRVQRGDSHSEKSRAQGPGMPERVEAKIMLLAVLLVMKEIMQMILAKMFFYYLETSSFSEFFNN